jgi:hypothetical protein
MLALAHTAVLCFACAGSQGVGLLGPLSGPPVQTRSRAEQAPRPARALEELRAGLRALPPAERARLERRLAEFESLPPEARRKVLERAHALRERERTVERNPPRELRRQMDGLDAEHARELWVSHLRERFREHGREVRERLPSSLRERLERASPEARRRLLERLFREREPVSRKALWRMGERLGLTPQEIRHLERLPLVERLHAMLEMRSKVRTGDGG